MLYKSVSVLLLSLCLDANFSTLPADILNCVLSLCPDIKFCTRVTTVDNILSSYSGGQDLYLVSETSYPERFLVVFLSYCKKFPGYYMKLNHYRVCPHALNLLFANNPII
jgi:hypothetical protein